MPAQDIYLQGECWLRVWNFNSSESSFEHVDQMFTFHCFVLQLCTCGKSPLYLASGETGVHDPKLMTELARSPPSCSWPPKAFPPEFKPSTPALHFPAVSDGSSSSLLSVISVFLDPLKARPIIT